MGVLGRLRDNLSRTKQQIVDRFEDLVRQADEPERRTRPIDVETLEALEEVLISADIGVAATERIIAAVRGRARSGESLRDLVKQEIRHVFAGVDHRPAAASAPVVTLVVGVNGTGKTTTVGKLANLLRKEGRQPLICAADTFRAAAVEAARDLGASGRRDIIRAKDGADPAAGGIRRHHVWKGEGPGSHPHRYRRSPHTR
jgi:fused signal recognition particle receptor